MKVLQLVGDSPVGGGTYLILEWCKYLIDKGCTVDVLSTNPPTQELLGKIPGVNIRTDVYIPHNIEILEDIKLLWHLFRFLHYEDYDVVHTYTATPGVLGRIAARFANIPVILHHQASWTVTEYSSFFNRIFFTPLEYLPTLASTYGICVSHAIFQLADQFHTAPLHKLVVICNGIDPDPFLVDNENERLTFRHELGIAEESILLGNTGRLSPDKDNASIIRALHILKSIVPERKIQLVLAGDGTMRYDLESLTKKFGLEKDVFFLGYRRDIATILASIDIFVSPSLREGLSISIMEAMAAAKPIVTTSILPNKELIKDEQTGLLVDPYSPQQIAQSIARFIHDFQFAESCAESARQYLIDNYHIDRMMDETWKLYVSLMQKQ